jgi:hypothetical protein
MTAHASTYQRKSSCSIDDGPFGSAVPEYIEGQGRRWTMDDSSIVYRLLSIVKYTDG